MQDSTRAKVSKPCRIPYLPKFRVRLHAAKRIQRFAEAETGSRGDFIRLKSSQASPLDKNRPIQKSRLEYQTFIRIINSKRLLNHA